MCNKERWKDGAKSWGSEKTVSFSPETSRAYHSLAVRQIELDVLSPLCDSANIVK